MLFSYPQVCTLWAHPKAYKLKQVHRFARIALQERVRDQRARPGSATWERDLGQGNQQKPLLLVPLGNGRGNLSYWYRLGTRAETTLIGTAWERARKPLLLVPLGNGRGNLSYWYRLGRRAETSLIGTAWERARKPLLLVPLGKARGNLFQGARFARQ